MAKTLREMIEVMEAAERGEEIQILLPEKDLWRTECWMPTWNWHTCDYRVKPKKRTMWINVYRSSCGSAYATREEADMHAETGRTACLKIEFTEGEGLE